MMNKKGIFIPVFVVLVILLLSISATYLYLSNKKTLDFHVGSKSTEIFSSYGKAEKALLYIDRAAEYSYFKSISYNMDNLNLDCGAKDGYNLLTLGEDECFLTNDIIMTKFEVTFNKYISEYLNIYKELDLKNLKYSLSFDNGKIMGKSDNKVIVDENNLKYEIEPSFLIVNSFDANKAFVEASDEVKRLYMLCKSDKNCWNNGLKEEYKLKNEGKVFMLDIDTGYKFGLSKEKFILKFGLNFETNPLFR